MKKFNKDKYLKKLKLKRFWQNNSRYFYIGISCVLCLVLGIYFTYSKFFVSSEEDVTRTTVGSFIYGDIIMTPYVDGQYSSTFPEKKTGINVEKVVCDNDVTASWDEDKWGLYATNLSKRTKCNVYFVTPASCGINDNVSCINSREGLATLATEVNNGDNKLGKIIYLTSDLDLGGKFDSNGNALDGNISWTPIGSETIPFSGILDGNGHIISNMYVNEKNEASLFICISNGKILNLGIENSYIKSKSSGASALAYKAVNEKVSNIYVNAVIDGKKSSASLFCWTSYHTNVSNSYNTGSINSNGEQFAAGLIGYIGGSDVVKNSYNLGNINGGPESSGIVGGAQGKINNCYNLGKITGTGTGGIVGQLYHPENPTISSCYNIGSANGGIIGLQFGTGEPKIINNYFLNSVSEYGYYSDKNNIGAEPLSVDEMPSVLSVINGDNAFVEDTNNINNGYPILKWQAERENN